MVQSDSFAHLRTNLLRMAPLPPSELDFLQRELEFLNVSEKTVLIDQGSDPTKIYFVNTGLMKVYFHDSRGKEVIKGFIPEGRLCAPYAAILTNRLSNVAISAMEDSELLALDRRILKSLYGRNFCWQEVGRKIAEGLLIEKELREQQMLMLSAEERYEDFKKNFGSLLERLALYEIASYLGITPEHFSQIRKKH